MFFAKQFGNILGFIQRKKTFGIEMYDETKLKLLI